MGKSKRMKKWGGAYDPNAVPSDPNSYGVAQNAYGPNSSTSTTTTTTVAPAPAQEKGLVDSALSFIGFGSSTKEEKLAEIDNKLKTNEVEHTKLEQERAAAAAQQGGRRHKRSHKKRSHKKRSRRSKRSRRHR